MIALIWLQADNEAARRNLQSRAIWCREFNPQLEGHIPCWYGIGISSSPTLCTHPFHVLVLVTVVLYV